MPGRPGGILQAWPQDQQRTQWSGRGVQSSGAPATVKRRKVVARPVAPLSTVFAMSLSLLHSREVGAASTRAAGSAPTTVGRGGVRDVRGARGPGEPTGNRA